VVLSPGRKEWDLGVKQLAQNLFEFFCTELHMAGVSDSNFGV